MKKILFLFLLLGSFSFSQGKYHTIQVDNAMAIADQKTKGEFKFIFPTEIKEDQITRTSSFYKEFFTVDFNKKTNVVKIKMVNNDEKSRHIIKRFLVANKINKVSLNQQDFTVDNFYTTHLK